MDPGPTSALATMGWGPRVREKWDALDDIAEARPARATKVDRRGVQAMTSGGLVRARMSRSAIRPPGMTGLPATGDWLALTTDDGGRHSVVAVLERDSVLSRRDPAERAVEQVLAANITAVFLVLALDGAINQRKIERGLVLAHEADATPVVVLTKTDLVSSELVSEATEAAQEVAHGVEVVALSSVSGEGVDRLLPHLGPGCSVALLGASGAGKSTLVNRLLGHEIQETAEVRGTDGKGRHTTTSRHLLPVPAGGVIVDTPGVRALGMWEASEGVSATFPDIVETAAGCRFNDCQHAREPGCAVNAALATGELDPSRLASYKKLQQEIADTTALSTDQKRRRGEGSRPRPGRRRR